MKVLVTEDQAVSRLMLDEWLQTWGYQPILASDGMEAWDILKDDAMDTPRLILLDWMMPRMDGVELCRRIRSDHQLPYIYIIMLTQKYTQEDLKTAMDAGADAFLSKPVQPENLHSHLQAGERILNRQENWLEEWL